MAGEERYINPIIQAMMDTARTTQAHQELAAKIAESKAHQKLQEHLADLHEADLNRQHEFQQKQLDISQALRESQEEHQRNADKLALESHQLNQLHTAGQFIAGGGSPAAFQKPGDTIPNVPGSVGGGTTVGGTPPGMLDIPGVGRIPQGSLPTPERMQAIRAQGLASDITAQHGALEPFQIREEERQNLSKKNLLDFENQFKQSIENQNLASKEKLAGLERSTQLAIHAMGNNTQLKVAGMHYAPDSDTLKSMAIAGMTGQTKLNFANPAERAAADSIVSAGGRVLEPKDADALRAMGQLPPVFDKIESFAKKYLPDETKSGSTVAKLKAVGQKLISGTPFPTDAKDEYDQIKTQALNLGRSLEGATGGRIPVMQIELMLNGMASLGKTKQQVLKDVENLRNVYTTRANDVLLGGMPDFQKNIIKKTYGFKDAAPPSYKHIAVGPNGHTIGSNDGQNWVDATTGQPLSAPGVQ